MANVKILCQDSVKWLKTQPDQSIPNFITGIPDLNELGKNTTLDTYLKFFNSVAELIFRKVKPNGYCIFIQTDRKVDRQLIDKSFLLTTMAQKTNHRLMWHKIVLQRDVNKMDLFRPTYSHFLCYTIDGSPGKAFTDVLPVGTKSYDNATPANASDSAADFISNQISKQTFSASDLPYDVVDPFVGQGTIGISALDRGLSFLGIDLDPKQCEITKAKLGA